MRYGRSAAQRIIEGDDTGASGGGPGGVTGRGPEISDEDSRAATGLYRRGAATNWVRALNEGPLQLRRMREAGLIETRATVKAQTECLLTPRGLQHVLAAATPAPAPGA
jgi:hypothetical protein